MMCLQKRLLEWSKRVNVCLHSSHRNVFSLINTFYVLNGPVSVQNKKRSLHKLRWLNIKRKKIRPKLSTKSQQRNELFLIYHFQISLCLDRLLVSPLSFTHTRYTHYNFRELRVKSPFLGMFLILIIIISDLRHIS